MLVVRLAAGRAPAAVVALPVIPVPDGPESAQPDGSQPGQSAALLPPASSLPTALTDECTALLAQVSHSGRAGVVHHLPRPTQRPHRVLLVGVGDTGEAGWRAAGAAIARGGVRETALTVALPAGVDPAAVRGLTEGLLLGSYRFLLGSDSPDRAPRLRRVTIQVDEPDRYEPAYALGQTVAELTCLARDLTNTPSMRKDPAWFVRQVEQASSQLRGVQLRVRDEADLREGGFAGILAVGSGSVRPPRLLEINYRPRGAERHVVLVGKGITFDTGGISIKPAEGMKLMRKDMGGAAAVAAATLGAARLRLPVRVTAVIPLAENMPGGSAWRPGDVVRHWGGKTSEIRNTDAEGRVVLADALAYAAARLRPDQLIDLATLTGANAIALGRRTGALYSEDADLAKALAEAAAQAGEQVWQMPLVEDYLEGLGSDLADVNNSPEIGAGSVLAALYLREFTGSARQCWAHIDMSAPSWSDRDDGELSRGATGWGVRTLLRWLESTI